MTQAVESDALVAGLAERTRANAEFFEAEAERLARLCHRMAERFARGGRLIAFGRTPAARSDARHVAVEFVHPVIVGKRALPAIGLAGEGGPLPEQVALLAEPDDIAIGFGVDEVAAAVAVARERGCLTLAFAPVGAEWEFEPPTADPSIRQELVETLYHVLWELVHVFFDHRGLLEGREARPVHDTGASSFLYPFLGEQRGRSRSGRRRRAPLRAGQGDGGRRAARADAHRQPRRSSRPRPPGCATTSTRVGACWRSATAAPPPTRWTPWRTSGTSRAPRALDLTEDAAILTAIANDIGTEAIFARQVIAHGRAGDALLAISTSGNSANVIAALGEARRRGLRTIAMVGYDGGRVAAERLADHVIVTRSEHIPRIQEAQASAYHLLRELVG